MRQLQLLSVLLAACSTDAPEADGRRAGSTSPTGPTTATFEAVPLTTAPPRELALCTSGSGATTVVWADDATVWAARADGLGAFAAPQTLATDLLAPSGLTLACEGPVAVAGWLSGHASALESPQPYASTTLDGLAWRPTPVALGLDDDATLAQGVTVAMAGSVAWAAWADSRNGSFDVFVSDSIDGGLSWSSGVRVDEGAPGATYDAEPAVAATASGAVVAWVTVEGSTSSLRTSAAPFTDVAAPAPGIGDIYAPTLCADGDAVHLVWHGDGGAMATFSADGGQTWLPQPLVLDRAGRFPACAAEGDQASLVWVGAEGLEAAHLERGVLLDRAPARPGPVVDGVVARSDGIEALAWSTLEASGASRVVWAEGLQGIAQGIDDGEGLPHSPRVGVGAGAAVLAWIDESEGDGRGLWVRSQPLP